MSALLAAVLLATPAFESPSRNVFAIDGIAGFGSFRRAYPESNDDPLTMNQVGALGMVPFTRLGYHRFVPRGISLGTSVQVLATDGSLWFNRSTVLFNLSPRIGWSTPLSSSVSAWFRVGPGIQYATTKGTREGQLSLGGEAILVIIPAHDLGITFSAFFDSGFAGREVFETTNTSRALRYRSLGIALGAVLAF